MNAIIYKDAGGPEVVQLVERPVPSPGAQEVLIKVRAAGINRPDVLQRQGLYNPPPGVTDIPGLEVSGEIVQLGSPDLPFKEGDTVCALIAGGGYAEYVSVAAENVARLPRNISFEEAAGMMETFMTVWSHLFHFAKFQAGRSILIHGGASGIGTSATMLCKAFGASQIFTTVSKVADQTASLELGADFAINYKSEDFVAEVKKHTQGKGVDFILDIIGGDYVQRNYAAAAIYGTVLQVGVMQGNAKSLNLFPMMAKRLTHLGITLRSQSVQEKAAILKDLQEKVWPLLESGRIRPQLHKSFKLSEAREAHEYFDQGKHFGKLVLIT